MITEDYVSYETARLLKEKGFNEGCSFVVNAESKGVMSVSWPTTNSDIEDEQANLIALPTLQMAMKWLREVHNIHIVIKSVIRTYLDTEYYYELYGTKNKSLCVVCDIYKGESWDSNEEACEAAIKYCLENLI